MNTNYTEELICKSDFIYIDTSSLLNAERRNNFLEFVKHLFLKHNKKIIVPDCVMAELGKHACSLNIEMRQNALNAFNSLRENDELFEFNEDYILPEGEENFADPKILRTLLDNRRQNSQLLISNDHGLTTDAFKLNKLESFYGNKIRVCYLTNDGSMKKCDCVYNEYKQSENIVYKDRIIEKEKTKFVREEKTFIDKYGLPIGGALGSAVMYCLCNWNKITKMAKRFA